MLKIVFEHTKICLTALFVLSKQVLATKVTYSVCTHSFKKYEFSILTTIKLSTSTTKQKSQKEVALKETFIVSFAFNLIQE